MANFTSKRNCSICKQPGHNKATCNTEMARGVRAHDARTNPKKVKKIKEPKIRSKRQCGFCKLPGHTVRTCNLRNDMRETITRRMADIASLNQHMREKIGMGDRALVKFHPIMELGGTRRRFFPSELLSPSTDDLTQAVKILKTDDWRGEPGHKHFMSSAPRLQKWVSKKTRARTTPRLGSSWQLSYDKCASDTAFEPSMIGLDMAQRSEGLPSTNYGGWEHKDIETGKVDFNFIHPSLEDAKKEWELQGDWNDLSWRAMVNPLNFYAKLLQGMDCGLKNPSNILERLTCRDLPIDRTTGRELTTGRGASHDFNNTGEALGLDPHAEIEAFFAYEEKDRFDTLSCLYTTDQFRSMFNVDIRSYHDDDAACYDSGEGKKLVAGHMANKMRERREIWEMYKKSDNMALVRVGQSIMILEVVSASGNFYDVDRGVEDFEQLLKCFESVIGRPQKQRPAFDVYATLSADYRPRYVKYHSRYRRCTAFINEAYNQYGDRRSGSNEIASIESHRQKAKDNGTIVFGPPATSLMDY